MQEPLLAACCLLSPLVWSTNTHYNTSYLIGFIARTHGCVPKWQWNARHCVTGLLERRSRECNPVTPVECVSLSFRTHPCVLAFIAHILCINGIEIAFVWLIWYNLCDTFFKFAVCFIAVMNLGETLKETWLGDGVADDAVATLLPLWLHAAALWRHAVCIRIVTSHNAWMGYEYSLQNLNCPRAIHKHNPQPLETMGRVW